MTSHKTALKFKAMLLCGCFISLASMSFNAVGQSVSMAINPAFSRFLELSPEQIKGLAQIERSWRNEVSNARKQLPVKREIEQRKALCRQMQERQIQVQNQAQAVLNEKQRKSLRHLRDAYQLMPLIESAQRANLLTDELQGPPSALPDGAVDTDFRYVRSVVEPLPGCIEPGSRPYATQESADGVIPPTAK